MFSKIYKKTKKFDFLIIDSQFPQKEPFAFRNSEINEYFKLIDNVDSMTMCKIFPEADAGFGHSYGVDKAEYIDNKNGYLSYYPENKNKIHFMEKGMNYRAKLAYSFFLAETRTLLPFYEKNKIPFVFVLYPGGLFGLDAEASDNILSRITTSKMFKGLIVTQKITKDYLESKNLCPVDKIHFIYGGFVQFKKHEVKPKKLYKKDKQSFDLCFVAAKYSEGGLDKGYDLFIQVAKSIAKQSEDVYFHVVGGFTEDDIDISDIKDRIKFYGYKKADFLAEFYSNMDIFLSPNRPFRLYDGNFDGFPLGIDAGYCGVALFVADGLNMNQTYINMENIVIIKLNANKISDQIMYYHKNPSALYELSSKGQVVTQKVFDIKFQIEERIKVFENFVKLKVNQE